MSEETTTQETVESTETEQHTQETIETVPKAELQKVLDEMHKYKKTAKEFEAKAKEQEMSKLKQQEEWQKVAEIKEREASEAIEKATRLEESFLNNRKYDAVKSAALQNGIRKEALNDLELIDFSDDIAIETTNTGKINVIGAETAVKKLKAQRPYWFGKSVGNVNTDNPDVVEGSEVTIDRVMEAQAKWRKSQSPTDMATYQKLMQAYQKQSRA
jgi:hypothetical protein